MDNNDRMYSGDSGEKELFLKRKKHESEKRKDDIRLQIENDKASVKNIGIEMQTLSNKSIDQVNCDNYQPGCMQATDDAPGGSNRQISTGKRHGKRNTKLFESIEDDNFDCAIKLLKKGASVEATCLETGLTACHICAFYGRDKILEELISRRANVSRVDNMGRLPLEIAIWQGHTKCVDAFLKIKNPQEVVKLSDEWYDINHDCLRLKHKTSEIWSNSTALHIASARLQVEIVRRLLTLNYSPLLNNEEGMTPLDVCGKAFLEDLTTVTEQRFFETIREFVTYAKINQDENDIQNTMKISDSGKMFTTPFHVAVLLDSKHSIQLLMGINAYPRCQDNNKQTPLHSAVASKKIKSLIALSSVGLDSHFNTFEIFNKSDQTALHVAVSNQWIRGVSILLEAGSDIMATTGEKNTVIHIAAETGNVVLLKLLIGYISKKKKKMLNCKNFRGFTPLYTAIKHCQVDFVKELLYRKAPCNIVSDTKSNVIHTAAQFGNAEILSLLLSEKNTNILINKQDVSKCTPLHWAASYNHFDCVKVLCDAGADMKLRASQEETPLHLAARGSNAEVVELLLSRHFDLFFERDRLGRLPFHLAACSGDKKCIDVFLKNGADFSELMEDDNGKKETVLATMTSNMQGSADYLDEVFNSYITTSGYCSQPKEKKIVIDYSILMPRCNKDTLDNSCETMKVMKALTTTNNKYGLNKLVLHPLIESFLYLQWKSLQRFFFCILFTYGFYVTALTISVIVIYKYEKDMKTPPRILHKQSWIFFLWLSIVIIGIQESLYIISKKFLYLYSYEVWVKLLSLGLALAVGVINHKVENHWPRSITAVAILLAWLEMIILLSRFPQFGYFYQMFSTVAIRAIKVLVLFGSFMIIGFSLAFWVLFNSNDPFDGLWKSIMKTIVMMTSEFMYSDIAAAEGWEQYSLFPQILFIVFLVLVPIVVMNLLLALAVSDVRDLEIEGKIQRLVQQVEFLSTMDTLHVEAWKYVPRFIKIYMIREVPMKVFISPCKGKLRDSLYFSECITTSIYQIVSMRKEAEEQFKKKKET